MTRVARGGVGLGGGGGGVYASIDAQDGTGGLEVSLDKDASWALVGEQRTIGVPPTLEIDGNQSGSSLGITLPLAAFPRVSDRVPDPGLYSQGNGAIVRINRVQEFVPEVPGVAGARATVRFNFQPGDYIDVSREDEGVDGNEWFVLVSYVDVDLTDVGYQLSTAMVDDAGVTGMRFHVLISTTQNPTVAAVMNAIGARDDFRITPRPGFASGGLQFPQDAATIFPDGEASGTNGRTEFLTGGVDEVVGVPEVAADPLSWNVVGNEPLYADLDVRLGDTLEDIAAVIRAGQLKSVGWVGGEGVFGEDAFETPDDAVVVVGGVAPQLHPDVFPDAIGEHVDVTFGGGVDEETLNVVDDADERTITLRYDVEGDRVEDVLAAFESSSANAVQIYGTRDDERLESPPFTRAFRGGGGTGAAVLRPLGAAVEIQQGETREELFSGVIDTNQNFQLVGTGIPCPSEGFLEIYVDSPSEGNREGAVVSARIPASRLLDAQEGLGVASSADNDDQRTIPFGANRYVAFACNEADDLNHLMIASQDAAGGGDYNVDIYHVTPNVAVDVAGPGIDDFINPKATYSASDVGKFIVEHDVIKQVRANLHEGHGKLVGGSASPGTFISLGPGDEGGGDGAHFRGWHFQPPNDVVSGDFYAHPSHGGFEIYYDGSESESGGVEGERLYNPFAVGAYWENVDPGDGTEFAVSFRGYRLADSQLDAFTHAAQAGEVFVVRATRQILVVQTISAPATSHVEYRAQLYRPPSGPTDMVCFWGEGQSTAYPIDPVAHTHIVISGSRYYRFVFDQETPNEIIYGQDFGVRCIDASEIPADTIDAATGETIADQTVFEFSRGTYQLDLSAQGRSLADTNFRIWIYCGKAGTDTIVRSLPVTYTAGGQGDPLGLQGNPRLYQGVDSRSVFTFDETTYLTIWGGIYDVDDEVPGVHVLYVTRLQ